MIAELLAALSEPEARLMRLVEWLHQTEPAQSVPQLAEALHHPVVLHALVNVRLHLSYARASELYVVADELGLEEVKHLLVLGPAAKAPVRKNAPDNPFIDKTLGERKALAVSRDRDVLDRLMHDRNPAVITILLKNPRLVERDVVRIAALVPTTVGVIEAITRNYKWLSRYDVKKAIVFNPYTPKNVARSLLNALVERDRIDAERLLFDRDEV